MHRIGYLPGGSSLILGLAFACLATACTVGASPALTSGTQGTGGTSGPNGTSGGTGGGTTSVGTAPFFGTVSLVEANAGSSKLYLGSAHFHASDGGDPFACRGTQAGDCCLTPAGTPPPEDELSAGQITFTSNGAQIGQIELDPGGYQTITSGGGNTAFHWSPGDTLGVSAAGDTIRAFSGTSIAPGELAGLIPMPSAITLIVMGADGLTLTWTPSSGPGSFHAVFVDGETNVLTCEAPLSAGTLDLPTALLTLLSGTGTFGLWPEDVSTFAGPNANLTLTVIGLEAYGNIAFQ